MEKAWNPTESTQQINTKKSQSFEGKRFYLWNKYSTVLYNKQNFH